MGITVPTPIQRLAIQPVLDGRDVIAKAETGTGKTLAFGAPMMAKIDPARASVLGLVLCPTRELAQQVSKVLETLGAARGVKVALIVGGDPMGPQVDALKAGAQVVVGTPGRVLDLYKQRFLSFPWTEFAILDEADVMLEIGFIDDVKMILSYTPDERQTLLFSATFPPELLKLAREYTRNPVEVATAAGVSTVDTITQSWIQVDDEDRALTLIRLVEQSDPDDVFLVFCDRRTEVDKLMRRLERLPFSIKALHGGYDQAARFRVMSAFRTGEVKVLVATDVASRGLDVAHVTTVLNYSAPQDVTDYTHRIGRTGRAGRKGRAITLVGGLDMRRWRPIQREATWDIPQVDAPRSQRSGVWRDDRPPRRPERGAHDDNASGGRRESRGASRPRSEPAAPPARPQPAHWPVDEHAHDESARHRDLRPNRESPRPARPEHPRRQPAPPARSERTQPPDRPAPAGPAPAREAHGEAGHRAPRRGERGPAREPRALPEPAAQPDRARRPDAEHRDTQRRPAGRRPAERPSAERHPPERHGTERRGTERRDAGHRDAGRRDAGRRDAAPRKPPVEERPPGTFERPMSGGLLGNAVRRPAPPERRDERPPRRGRR
jgi:superfamily II DNA/RNA helicase